MFFSSLCSRFRFAVAGSLLALPFQSCASTRTTTRYVFSGAGLFCLVLSVLFSRYLSIANTTSKMTRYERLPENPRPKHYSLTFEPNLVNFDFVGHAKIQMEVSKPIPSFDIYASELNIADASLLDPSGAERNVTISERPDERIRLSPNKELSPGIYELRMNFTGVLNDRMNGFYRSTYKSSDGETKVMAITQFEPAYARKAFPGWDEPNFKATFDVSIIAEKSKTVLSNMPAVRESDLPNRPGLKQVWFGTSPKMSTYLLAFIVGDLGHIETVDENGVVVRVFTRPGSEAQGSFSLDVASKVLPFYADYFGLKYPLPKLDLVAIPDFAAGAMENWGLVTYRETALLVDPTNTSKASRQYVALVVSHELAHQWFGNLVTMEWWTDLWLNEGFATWIEFLSVHTLLPNLDIWTQFVYLDLRRALQLDGLRSSHPIEVEVGSPEEVDQIFDSISYSKGASIIRMLHNFMGSEAFKAGLRTYLKEFEYSNARTENLWQHLSKAAGKDVGAVMSDWTRQMGYPLLNIIAMEPVGEDLAVTMEQSRFLVDGKEDDPSYKWQIPVSLRFSSDPHSIAYKFLLKDKKATITIPGAAEERWIKFNANSVGFYITQYPTTILSKLISAVPSLEKLDRFGLQSDLFMLCNAGKSSLVDYLKLCQAYSSHEKDYTVWRDVLSNIAHIRVIVEQTGSKETMDRLNAYQIALVRPVYEELKWVGTKDEDDLMSMLRGVVINAMGMANDAEVVQKCVEMFRSGKEIDPNLRAAVYAVVAHSDSKYLDALMKLHQTAELSEEQNRVLSAMGLVVDPEAKLRVLDYSIGEHVRPQDTYMAFMSVASDMNGRWLVWKFFQDNFKLLMDRYHDSGMIASLIKRSFNDFCDMRAADEMKAFFEKNKVPFAEMAIKQVLETIATNVKTLERNAKQLEDFLK